MYEKNGETMHKNPDTGFVEYDRDKCASCYMCVMACPLRCVKERPCEHKEIL